MPLPAGSALAALCDGYVADLFAFDPGEARSNGDHTFDGLLGPVGADATAQRVAALRTTMRGLEAIVPEGREQRADAITLRHRLALELFHLTELQTPRHNPLPGLFRGAYPQPYCMHDYAPVPARAEGLTRQLEQVPEYLDATLAELDESLEEGPRSTAISVADGLASFFTDGLESTLPLDGHPELRARLQRAAASAAASCRRYSAALEPRGGHPAPVLGETRFLAFLAAQEGVHETLANLRSLIDGELATLGAEFEEVAGLVSGGRGAAVAVELMEQDHPDAGSLIDEAASSLDRVRAFWIDRDVVTIPDAPCRVTPSPPFLRFVSAAFDGAGTLSDPRVMSNYIVTPVEPGWSDEQADQWLRAMNRSSLENVGVHEVYPGHFVHELHARAQPSLVRKIGFLPAFGEGWAHYTERLAVEQGLADGRPLLRLAQVQDALLRACRFRATLALHTEGATVDDATALFVQHAALPEFPARREAERGTYDPMYLSYTYGKLQILRWRAQLERRPGFSLRTFHDTMLGSGSPPLAAVEEIMLGT